MSVNRCRLYTSYNKVKTWTQRKCLRCKRYLSIKQRKYCSKCKPLMKYKVGEFSHKQGRNLAFYYSSNTIMEITGHSLPFHIRNIIQNYVW